MLLSEVHSIEPKTDIEYHKQRKTKKCFLNYIILFYILITTVTFFINV